MLHKYTVVFGNILLKSGHFSGAQVCHIEAPVDNTFGSNFSIIMNEAFAIAYNNIKIHGYSSIREMRNAEYDIYAVFKGHHDDIM